jgi:hypothetical protein
MGHATTQVYLDTADYMSYIIKTDAVAARPDIALLYYPPVFNFYLFAARTLAATRAAGVRASAASERAPSLLSYPVFVCRNPRTPPFAHM